MACRTNLLRGGRLFIGFLLPLVWGPLPMTSSKIPLKIKSNSMAIITPPRKRGQGDSLYLAPTPLHPPTRKTRNASFRGSDHFHLHPRCANEQFSHSLTKVGFIHQIFFPKMGCKPRLLNLFSVERGMGECTLSK